MSKYWLISDRNQGGTGPGRNVDGLTFWTSEGGPLGEIGRWERRTHDQFRARLIAAAEAFPALPHGGHEAQSHVAILVHGFNVGFEHSARFYEEFCGRLFDGPESLGLCILYDWPSLGSLAGYEPDRAHARDCAGDLADILAELFDWLLRKQQEAANTRGDAERACRAKVSVIAHSMGNYLVQQALAAAWTRKNQPLLVSLINQLIMIAADVDNDLFDAGAPDHKEGAAMANLTYRITSLYSGRDAALGASSGLKHFGTRRLGRSGLAHRPPLASGAPATDNVWDVDCSSFFPAEPDIHGAYFRTGGTLELIRQIMRGVDRGVLAALGFTAGQAWPPTR